MLAACSMDMGDDSKREYPAGVGSTKMVDASGSEITFSFTLRGCDSDWQCVPIATEHCSITCGNLLYWFAPDRNTGWFPNIAGAVMDTSAATSEDGKPGDNWSFMLPGAAEKSYKVVVSKSEGVKFYKEGKLAVTYGLNTVSGDYKVSDWVNAFFEDAGGGITLHVKQDNASPGTRAALPVTYSMTKFTVQ